MVLLTLAVCSPAQAGYWSDADVQTAIRVADARWPNSPCAGREALNWVVMPLPAAFEGQAYPDGTCRVDINAAAVHSDSSPPDHLCAVLEHEFGHLYLGPTYYATVNPADPEHSPNPRSIMFTWPLAVPHDCAKAFPARAMCRYLGPLDVTVRPMVADTCW